MSQHRRPPSLSPEAGPAPNTTSPPSSGTPQSRPPASALLPSRPPVSSSLASIPPASTPPVSAWPESSKARSPRELFTITAFDGWILIVRTEILAISTLQLVQATRAANRDIPPTLDRSQSGLLIDVRAASGKNDPEFETEMRNARIELQKGFAKVAMVVSSAAGQLQVERLFKSDNIRGKAFLSPAEAVSWIKTPD